MTQSSSARRLHTDHDPSSHGPHGLHGHAVQFYEDDAYIEDALAELVGGAIASGHPAIVIATREHLAALRSQLASRSIAIERAEAGGSVVLLDAHVVLDAVMVNGAPSVDRFDANITTLVRDVTARSGGRPPRAFGEMVDILMARGEPENALALERLWNELAAKYELFLLCGYSLDNFGRPEDAKTFADVCVAHSHVRPTERFSRLVDEHARLREVVHLQQRARALEAEIERRAQVEKELLNREAELRDFIENGVECMHWVGPDGKIIFANDAELQLLGYEREEYVGRHVRDVHVDSPVIDEILTRLSRGETLRDFEARLRCKDGSVRTVLIHSNVYWRDGRFVHTRCFTRDITLRKRALEELREQSRINENLVRVGSALSSELDVEVLVHKITEEARALCRAQVAAFVEDVPVRQVMRSADAGVDGRWEKLATRLPGSVRSALAVPVRSRAGHLFGALVFGHAECDVFRDSDERLVAAIAAQAAVALDNATLFAQLQVANRAKDEFLATVSHELRTPLNAILGWARMVRSGALSAEKTESALEAIERNAKAQGEIIDDLLDVSRIVSGHLRLDVGHIDVITIIERALDVVTPAAHAKGVVVESEADPDLPQLCGDPDRLQQVVWNLLTNAVKFTPNGGRVTIAARAREGSVEIIVTDSGQGIDPGFLPHVFERFRQADATPSRRHGGLGLGLSIVRHLVELHGGTVRADSEGPGRGAVFTVLLPTTTFQARPAGSARALSTTTTSDLEGFAELAGVSVLVVDDEEDARDVLSEMLGMSGAKVTAASSAAEALELVEKVRPDLIVSDVSMPDEDGYSFVRKLRALPQTQGGLTPAVALTAYTRLEDRTTALLAGFNMHVPKPVEPRQLLAVLVSLSTMFERAR